MGPAMVLAAALGALWNIESEVIGCRLLPWRMPDDGRATGNGGISAMLRCATCAPLFAEMLTLTPPRAKPTYHDTCLLLSTNLFGGTQGGAAYPPRSRH